MKVNYFFTLILISISTQVGFARGLLIEAPKPEQARGVYPLVYIAETPYVSVNEIAEAYGIRTYFRKETGKLVLYFDKEKIKVSATSCYVMVGNGVQHMPQPSLLIGEQIYVPVYPFMEILKNTVFANLRFYIVDAGQEYVAVAPGEGQAVSAGQIQPERQGDFSVTGIEYEERKNGLLVKLSTSKPFVDSDFSTFFKDQGWFYLTINGGLCDSLLISSYDPTESLSLVKAINSENAVQLSFKTKKEFKSAEIHYDLRNKQVLLSFFTPLSRDIMQKIEEAKTVWLVDTIVLDAGHGGQDSGTPGHWGNPHEKDIVLDVTLRLGELLEKHGGIKVVYTRKTDEFIPLWKRPEIANKANGKLFISIHANGVENPNAHGFELYMLGQGRTEDAIKAAEKENAVIQLESADDKRKYEGYNDIANILANMVHSVNMGDSERLAGLISKRVSDNVPQHNRGVKQDVFYVLVGADMPKVLIELGFNSNRNEAKLLNSKKHRQLLAETLYESIIEFKEICDKSVTRGY